MPPSLIVPFEAVSNYPCRCLCFGVRLQITRITPLRLITLQYSQRGLTDARTFIPVPPHLFNRINRINRINRDQNHPHLYR
jgi:hypothetical protein